jgi:hypothetical protein
MANTYQVTVKGTIEVQANSMDEAEDAVWQCFLGDMHDEEIIDVTGDTVDEECEMDVKTSWAIGKARGNV